MSAQARLFGGCTARFRGHTRFHHQGSGSLAIGQAFTDLLRGQCRKLATLPGTLGRPRPELRADLRSFAFRRYVIFFRYDGDVFEVVNVLEGHRDILDYYEKH